MNEATLERRYRRLLACYPVAHRVEYADEMVGVLLASTPAGQRWPGLGDTMSLFGGGLRVRLRGLVTNSPDPGWRQALTVTTLIAPVLLAVMAWHQIGWHLAFAPSARWGRPGNAALMLIPLVLGLIRLRPLAAAAAAGLLMWTASMDSHLGYLAVPSIAAFLVLMAMQTVAYAFSPGPLSALLRIRGRALVLTMPWLLGAAYLTRVIPTHYQVPLWVSEVGTGAVAFAGLPALVTAGGRRLLMLLVAIPLSAEVITVLSFARVDFYAFSQSSQLLALYLPPAVLGLLTAWIVGRSQRRAAPAPSQPSLG
jgi:hypothetical protein